MTNQELTASQRAEIAQAEQNATRHGPADHVRQWLQDVHIATFATLAVKAGIEGFPTNSVVPFALDKAGHPFVLIANIAAHTQNLKQDTRCSLFIREGDAGGDPQAQWRATLVGFMERLIPEGTLTNSGLNSFDTTISINEYAELKARYRERVPKSDEYFLTHDFYFWRMRKIEKIRYIAGFGRICWLDGDELFLNTRENSLMEAADAAIQHMNEDHIDALEVICRNLHNVEPIDIKMTALDSRGFFCETKGLPGLLYTSFGRAISAIELRQAMIEVTKRARRGGN